MQKSKALNTFLDGETELECIICKVEGRHTKIKVSRRRAIDGYLPVCPNCEKRRQKR